MWKLDSNIAIKSKYHLSESELIFCKGVEFVLKTSYTQIFLQKYTFVIASFLHSLEETFTETYFDILQKILLPSTVGSH